MKIIKKTLSSGAKLFTKYDFALDKLEEEINQEVSSATISRFQIDLFPLNSPNLKNS